MRDQHKITLTNKRPELTPSNSDKKSFNHNCNEYDGSTVYHLIRYNLTPEPTIISDVYTMSTIISDIYTMSTIII